jgi:hypothetical protein
MARWIIKVTLALVLLVGAGLGTGYWFLDQQFNRYRGLPKVLAAPPGTLDPVLLEPYTGPHPRSLVRPQENFPFPLLPGDVGPVEPLFADKPRYPYLCRSVESDLGQPLVDNQEGYGMAVFREDADGQHSAQIEGYSQDCLLPTTIHYWYQSTDGEYRPFDAESTDIAQVEIKGRMVPFVVRVETGTINRHIYLIAVLSGGEDRDGPPDLRHWNNRLIYYFRGGVGIGHRQGRTAIGSILRRRGEEIARGYALAYSSANQTSNSYDIWLAEDTASRVKRQFTSAYGKPLYTIGIGGSGGAIQQYLLGQNRPGLLDAAIPLYSFPDMVTQSIHILDCELLAYYFDVTDADNPRWESVAERSLINGSHFNQELAIRFAPVAWLSDLSRGEWPPMGQGSTECTRSWRGMTPLVLNPRFAHFATRFDADLASQVEWTYWSDLRRWFGTDADGLARRTWDNVGVQYGLSALRDGHLSPAEFIDLNRRIGGWKPTREMAATRMWVSDAGPSSLDDYSPWDHHNINEADESGARQRTHGDPSAIAAAWLSGQVFTGVIDIPVIDLRHYLEAELDMHHASATFSTRQRIIDAMGNADHQLVWMTRRPHQPYAEAFEALDRWLANIADNPDVSLADNRPDDVIHQCWDEQGNSIASGDRVWDGAWNDRPEGECMNHYPIYGTSRTRTGDSLRGDRFRCTLIDLERSLDRGDYQPIDMRPHLESLANTFPDGVCDLNDGSHIPGMLIGSLRDLSSE